MKAKEVSRDGSSNVEQLDVGKLERALIYIELIADGKNPFHSVDMVIKKSF